VCSVVVVSVKLVFGMILRVCPCVVWYCACVFGVVVFGLCVSQRLKRKIVFVSCWMDIFQVF